MMFRDRVNAGRQLAAASTHLRDADVVVLGLPRGGVPVAFEVARVLRAPLDVIIVRKIGVPWQPELAMGAVGEDGACVVDAGVVRAAGVRPDEFAAAQAYAWAQVHSRLLALRGGHRPVAVAGRTVVIVDDGAATGSTALAACRVARSRGVGRVVLAVPVAPPDALARLSAAADEVVCLHSPAGFDAVGRYYQHFAPTSDGEVNALLNGDPSSHPAVLSGRSALNGASSPGCTGPEAIEKKGRGA